MDFTPLSVGGSAGPAALPGTKGLKGQVLVELKKAQPLAVKEFAERFKVSANAVRRHLKELEAAGLIHAERTQQGVGAPAYVYRLTERGESLFPNGYRDTLTAFLDHVAEKSGRAAVVEVFEARYAELARKLKAELAVAPDTERLSVVARVLSEAGYMAEWHDTNGTFHLAEHNCAMHAVALKYPELCAAEERFLQAVLDAEVRREAHIVSGCNACEYAISFPTGGRSLPVIQERA